MLRLAPHLAIGGAIVIALAVWGLVSWANRRKIAKLKAENGAWEAKFSFAHHKEAVVSEKSYELEATVQLLSNQIAANATTGNRCYNAEGCSGRSRTGFGEFGIV